MLEKILERFTSVDPRTKTPAHVGLSHIMGKSIKDPDVNKKLYTGLLPPQLIKNKRVLDIGPYIFLSGAWSLYHGAKHVTGVEYSNALCKIGRNTITEFYESNWNLVETYIENFIADNNEHYDIILIAGTIQKISNKTNLLLWCTEHCDHIIIESNYPALWHYLLDQPRWWSDQDQKIYERIYSPQDKQMLSNLMQSAEYSEWFLDFIKNKLPFNQHSFNTGNAKAGVFGNANATTYTSPNFYKHFFEHKGWQYQSQHSDYLTEHMPDYYTFPRRYCVAYKKVA